MPLSTRFPVAVHILTMLAIKSDGFISSEMIAKSVRTNAVVVRRILSLLQTAGMVCTQAGIQGGAKLSVDPRKVSLLDIYDAVEEQNVFRVHHAHPECPVASSVCKDVDQLLCGVEDKMRSELKKTKLARITEPAIEHYRQRTS